MDLKDIGDRHRILEQKLCAQLVEFENETGVLVSDISFDRSHEMGVGKGVMCLEISLEIKSLSSSISIRPRPTPDVPS